MNLLVASLKQDSAPLENWRDFERISFDELADVVVKDAVAEGLVGAIREDPFLSELMPGTFALVERLDDWYAGKDAAPVAEVEEHPEWTTLVSAANSDYGVTLPEDRSSQPRISLFWDTHGGLRRVSIGWRHGGGVVLSVAGGECGHYYRGACTGGTCSPHCIEAWVSPPNAKGGWVCDCRPETS